MKPSTTARETSSRFPMRASTAGSMNRAPGMAWISVAMANAEASSQTSEVRTCWLLTSVSVFCSHSRPRERHDVQQPIDDLIRRHPLRLRVEVGDDAVTQDRVRQRADVLEADVIAPAGQCARFAAEHQVLSGAHAGAERHPFLDEVLRVG